MAEELGHAVRWASQPWKYLRVPAEPFLLALMLSLRFLGVVFEEIRNLALGLAARRIPWGSLGFGPTVDLFSRVVARLLSNLLAHAQQVAVALEARGLATPEGATLFLQRPRASSWVANVLALAGWVGFFVVTVRLTP